MYHLITMADSGIIVGVLRGGPSSEYEVSLRSGAAVLKHLHPKYEPRDIFISKEGEWHVDGISRPPERILNTVDVVWNGLHGEYGEDGKVQRLLDNLGVRYTGSGSVASALAMNKLLTKKRLAEEGILMPRHIVVRKQDGMTVNVQKIFHKISPPYVVKPISLGSSVGVSVAKTIPELKPALQNTFAVSREALVEELVFGKEATCGAIDNFRGQDVYSLLPIEIRYPKTCRFFDYDAKYSGVSEEICPGNFSREESAALQNIAAKVHKVLGLRHYSRSDFIVHPRRGPYFLETNTLPGMTEESLLPKALKAVGTELSEFLDHVLTLVLEGK